MHRRTFVNASVKIRKYDTSKQGVAILFSKRAKFDDVYTFGGQQF